MIEEGDFVEYQGEYWVVVGVWFDQLYIFNNDVFSFSITVFVGDISPVPPDITALLLLEDKKYSFCNIYSTYASACSYNV